MASSFSRDSQLPVEPGLPIPEDDLKHWVSSLTGRLYWWIKAIAISMNFMIQGYQRTVASLPTAAQKYQGQMVVVPGSGATPDHLYLCIYNGSGYAWQLII